ncbi:hypothetical protein Misp06_01185 [Microbulbifer sp. NBRC 101763]
MKISSCYNQSLTLNMAAVGYSMDIFEVNKLTETPPSTWFRIYRFSLSYHPDF